MLRFITMPVLCVSFWFDHERNKHRNAENRTSARVRLLGRLDERNVKE